MQSASTFDWNAAAAWIALAISLVGSIAGPIITTILTNRHQLKLRMMDIHEKPFLRMMKSVLMHSTRSSPKLASASHTETIIFSVN